MKKILSIFMLISSVGLFSQDLPKVVPPSPNASAFHVYGNTQVNNYTGTANIQIPIYTINEGGLTLPIYLKYTGGNGIKVDEIGSWTGIGWTLNAGGAISREIRGLADEDQTKTGFFNMNQLPDSSSSNFDFLDIGNNMKDGEPDKFMYNYPGGSGAFFYDINNSIHLKPKKEIIISHNIGVQSEQSSSVFNQTYDDVITDFTIKDEYGNIYFFEDKERSNTVTSGARYEDNRGFPSSWFLSNIKNMNETKEINLEYDTYEYTLVRRQGTIELDNYSQPEVDAFSQTAYIGKYLNKITFSLGSIEFLTSTIERKDLSGTKMLKKIIVKNPHNIIIKEFTFSYKYMTENGFVDENSSVSNEDEKNRLFLSSITECDGNNNCKPSTEFAYEDSVLLPPRFSKAQDHWGYYNGEITNTKYSSKQYVPYVTPNDPSYTLIGTANKEPKHSFAKSGLLKSIKYPTGAETLFDYEPHTALTDKIPGEISEQSVLLDWDGVPNKKEFIININRVENPYSKVYLSGILTNETGCDLRVYIENKNTNIIHEFFVDNSNGTSNQTITPSELFLEAGTYDVWFFFRSNSNSSSCRLNNPQLNFLRYETEDPNPNRLIGGFRIAQVADKIPELASTNINVKKINYENDDGFTSGRIINAPRYYGIIDVGGGGSSVLRPVIFTNPVVPLAMTQGSDVGYGKVTVSHLNNINGKTEYYYKTVDNAPDGYNAQGNDSYYNLDGNKIESYPFSQTNSNDFLRGSILKEIQYSNIENNLAKVFEKTYEYEELGYFAGLPESAFDIDNNIFNETKVITGLKVYISGSYSYYSKYYDIYTGYTLPKSVIEKKFNDSGILTTTTEKLYDKNVDGVIQHYISLSSETTDSKGNVIKTETDYVFNKTNKTPAETALETANALYLPLQTKIYNGNTLLSTQYTKYNNTKWQDLNLPETIQTSKGTNSPEDRINYHEYDNKGNPTIVSKKDGTKIYYVWGYNQNQPIAKIENYVSTTSSQQTAINNAISASNIDNDTCLDSENCLETTLRTKLQDLRNAFPDAQVTTFTYNPLVGVTSITDPRGQIVYYEYDNFNRLEYVKDNEGNILSKNQYNYKN